MRSAHPKYPRIIIDGFFDGSVPEDVYRSVMGEHGSSLVRAKHYATRVVQLIDDLASCAVAKLFLTHLSTVGSASFGILIRPSESGQRLSDELDSMAPVTPAGAYAQSSPLPGRASARGTGAGTSVKITFNPAVPNSCGFLGGPGAVLFHELAHALRAIAGTMLHKPMNRYDYFEEFVAITLTNMLLSEQGQPLRDGHDCKALQMSLADFTTIYRRPLQQMKDDAQNRQLFVALGQLPEQSVPWNPLRA